MKKLLWLVCVSCGWNFSEAQLRWDGGAGDGSWMSPLNWSDDRVPVASDDVLLDNFFVSGDYQVGLPSGNIGVVIKSLVIEPGWSRRIVLAIPPDNTAAPAFSVIGSGYGMVLGAGAVFRNASGAAAGSVVSFADSVMIKNGGRYIHNTERSHAALVTILSRSPGTEIGVFEFDVPGTTGYTISGSGRHYGSLVLSSSGSGKSYLMSGSNPLNVRGNLEIMLGAGLSIDFSADVNVNGSLRVDGMVDLGQQTKFFVRGALTGGGSIKEEGNEFPVIEMMGTAMQDIHFTGRMAGDISLKINNASGVSLSAPLLLPYRLYLEAGRLFTSPSALLVMDTSAAIIADSLRSGTFVNGPLRFLGFTDHAYTIVPVGKAAVQRWIGLKDVSGNLEIEFFRADPHLLSAVLVPGIHHISGIEYWRIVADGDAGGAFELSFDNVNSGGVTSVAHLAVAALWGSPPWTNAGNTGTTGSAGFRGSVTGNHQSFNDTLWLTLASTDSAHNLLPVKKSNAEEFRTKPQQKTRIRVYPTILDADKITLEINAAKNAVYQVVITDLFGRILYGGEVRTVKGLQKINLDLPRLSRGNYILSVANKNNETLTQRFFRK